MKILGSSLKSRYPVGSAAYLRESRLLYRSAPDDVERLRFNEETGGFLLVHARHDRGEGFNAERLTFGFWADEGRRCLLLPEADRERSPDANVNEVSWEHKQIGSQSVNPVRTMQGALRDGKEQAANVAVLVNRPGVDVKDLNRGTGWAFYHDSQEKLQTVALVFQNGSTQFISRREWDYGNERFRDPEGDH